MVGSIKIGVTDCHNTQQLMKAVTREYGVSVRGTMKRQVNACHNNTLVLTVFVTKLGGSI